MRARSLLQPLRHQQHSMAAVDSAKLRQGKGRRRKGEKNLASPAEVEATADVDKAKRNGTIGIRVEERS